MKLLGLLTPTSKLNVRNLADARIQIPPVRETEYFDRLCEQVRVNLSAITDTVPDKAGPGCGADDMLGRVNGYLPHVPMPRDAKATSVRISDGTCLHAFDATPAQVLVLWRFAKVMLRTTGRSDVRTDVVFVNSPIVRYLTDTAGSVDLSAQQRDFLALTSSGVNVPGGPGFLVVTRGEEAVKLLAHEMLHLMGVGNLEGAPVTSEGIVEALATLWHLAWIAAIAHAERTDAHKWLDTERAYSLYALAKFLRASGLKSDRFLDAEGVEGPFGNFYGYYAVRALLLYRYDEVFVPENFANDHSPTARFYATVKRVLQRAMTGDDVAWERAVKGAVRGVSLEPALKVGPGAVISEGNRQALLNYVALDVSPERAVERDVYVRLKRIYGDVKRRRVELGRHAVAAEQLALL